MRRRRWEGEKRGKSMKLKMHRQRGREGGRERIRNNGYSLKISIKLSRDRTYLIRL